MPTGQQSYGRPVTGAARLVGSGSRPVRLLGRKRVLIVNCYVDETREAVKRTHKIPQAMGPVYLAGAFAPELCEVRLHNELTGGPLEDERLLGWPDMLVLTGLTTALDRMLHLTAYARSRNPRVVVVAGGHAVRALPRYCRRFFDYACLGDVEELGDVVREAFGAAYVRDPMEPRFDLASWMSIIGYVETSRHCNFRCTFCTLTGENRRYQAYEVDVVRRQLEAMGRRRFVVFLDNNFYGVDRAHFRAKLEVIGRLRREGWFTGWAALVTQDFFSHDDNLRLAREAGCIALFSGIESFDAAWLRSVNKLQNSRMSPFDAVRRALEARLVFLYGVVLDVATRPIADLEQELDAILDTPEIPAPVYVSVSIPILGTPFFYDCLKDDRLLPRTRVRDLDGTTLSLRPRDDQPRVEAFVRDLWGLRGRRTRVARHAYGFARRWRSSIGWGRTGVALSGSGILCAPVLTSAPARWGRPSRRTFVSTTEILDRVYQPAFRVAAGLEAYFEPTLLTDAAGRLNDALAPDILDGRHVHPPGADAGHAAPTSA